MVKTMTIIMRGKQHVILINRKRLPEDSFYSVRVDDDRQTIMFKSKGRVDAVYKVSPYRQIIRGKEYVSYRVGLHPDFIRNSELSKGDKVNVDYRKDRVIITSSAINY